ncbi:hypothetical protein PMAYCL1PPCAC_31756, partial [Pristionchus mayeri]
EGNSSCRQCRLDRWNDVIKKCYQGLEMALAPSCSSSSNSPTLSSPGIPSLICEPSLIDRVRLYYQRLSAVRRNHELALRGVIMDPYTASRDEYEIVPCTYQVMNQSVRIMVSSLFDFAAALLPEFIELPLSDKWLLIRNFQSSFHCIESHMRTQRYFTMESGRCFSTYTTYLSTDNSAVYFSDCTNKTHIGEAARMLEQCIRENCHRIRDHLNRVRPSDDEFMALMVIAFWSIDSINAHESLLDLASRYRTKTLSRLMTGYKETIGAVEGAVRIGELYGILDIIKRAEANMKWEFEVYRVLDLFEDDTYMYAMQSHKPDTICRSLIY